MAGSVSEVTDTNFQAEVIESRTRCSSTSGRPGAARAAWSRPVLEEIASERENLRVVKLNVDENQRTAAQFEVLSIPTLILFKNGAGRQEGRRGLPEAASSRPSSSRALA